jgi:hypothetical protein
VKPEDYPFRATTDAATAMANALAAYLGRLRFGPPRALEPWSFSRVFVRWAPFEKRAKEEGLRVAAVLADSVAYEPVGMTPRLLEETWSGGDPRERDELCRPLYPIGDGSGCGLALVEGDVAVVPFVIAHRTLSSVEQQAANLVLEQAFAEDETLLDPAGLDPRVPFDAKAWPTRNGRVLSLPDYFDRRATFTLRSATLTTTGSSARENRWISRFEVEGRVGLCALREVRAMRVCVRPSVDGAPAGTSSASG